MDVVRAANFSVNIERGNKQRGNIRRRSVPLQLTTKTASGQKTAVSYTRRNHLQRKVQVLQCLVNINSYVEPRQQNFCGLRKPHIYEQRGLRVIAHGEISDRVMLFLAISWWCVEGNTGIQSWRRQNRWGDILCCMAFQMCQDLCLQPFLVEGLIRVDLRIEH